MLTGSSHQLCRALTGLAVGDEGPRSRSPAGRPADRIAVGTGLLQPAASSGRRGTSARTSVRTTTVARDDAEGVSAAGAAQDSSESVRCRGLGQRHDAPRNNLP